MAGSINIALQGLSAAMRGFETSSNNISNVNTPGYSRQQIELSSRAAPEQGVQVVNVGRVADQFATSQLWSSSATYAEGSAFSFNIGQIDDLLANPNTSISAAMDQFFAALQTGVDDPSSIPNRELIVAQADALALRFNEVDRQLRAQNESVNSRLTSDVLQVNAMAQQMAVLNENISLADARGEPANELKDQRDELILAITEKIGGTIQTSTGSTDINIFIGNGQPLVVGGNASELLAKQGDPDISNVDVFVNVNGRNTRVNDEIRDGEVGGLIRYKEDALIPTWNELGRLAIVYADTLNQQHRDGVDLDGKMAGNWFSNPIDAGDIKAFGTNVEGLAPGASKVRILDTAQLVSSDYTVKFGESGKFSVTRESDGVRFDQDDFESIADWTGYLEPVDSSKAGVVYQDVASGIMHLNIDGLDITLGSKQGIAFAENDKVLIQPVRRGAELIDLELKAGRELGFASPVRTDAPVDNSGTVAVGKITVTDPQLFGEPGNAVSMARTLFVNNPPVELVFSKNSNGDTVYTAFDVSDPLNPVPYVFDSLANDPAKTVDPTNPARFIYQEGAAIGFNSFQAVITGKPDLGDKLSFSANTDAVSDNRNALQLSDLQGAPLIEGASYQDNYSRLIERIGTSASIAEINLQASETIKINAESVRNGISGVNLDEEAANLILYQQQYQAASQVINTAKQLFDTLLSATG